jgi:hypothetical protein
MPPTQTRQCLVHQPPKTRTKADRMNSDNLQPGQVPNQTGEDLKVSEVEGRKALNDFIRLPWSLYDHDPMWIPPLLLERRMHLSAKNPYFEHAQFCS